MPPSVTAIVVAICNKSAADDEYSCARYASFTKSDFGTAHWPAIKVTDQISGAAANRQHFFSAKFDRRSEPECGIRKTEPASEARKAAVVSPQLTIPNNDVFSALDPQAAPKSESHLPH